MAKKKKKKEKKQGIEGHTHNGQSKRNGRFRHFRIEFSNGLLTKRRKPENIDTMLFVGLCILLEEDLQDSDHRGVFEKSRTSSQSLLIQQLSNKS